MRRKKGAHSVGLNPPLALPSSKPCHSLSPPQRISFFSITMITRQEAITLCASVPATLGLITSLIAWLIPLHVSGHISPEFEMLTLLVCGYLGPLAFLFTVFYISFAPPGQIRHSIEMGAVLLNAAWTVVSICLVLFVNFLPMTY